MSGKVIGTSLNNGFAGCYARQPDMIIQTRANKEATDNIKFGTVLENTVGGVKKATATFTNAKFAGIAGREVKSALNYADQNAGGEYQPNEAVSVFQRGSINVICANGNPAVGGAVYVALTTSAFSGAKVGDIAAAVTGTANTDYITLTNAQWGGAKDANGVAELVLLTRANA